MATNLYAKNALALKGMLLKALASGKTVGGYTAEELAVHVAAYERLASGSN